MKKRLSLVLAFALLCSTGFLMQKRELWAETASPASKKVTFVLDWVPNTNHTGLYVAQNKGYFKDEGLEVDIVQPSEESSSTLVASGRAEFGVYFQPNMVKRLEKQSPITAIAAICQHNTGGIMSLKEAGIDRPKALEGKKYSTWEDPIDDATVRALVEADGGQWDQVQLVPGESTDATTALKTKLFDAIFVYAGWDLIHAQALNTETNFFYLKDLEPRFDYYTPVIIANNDFLKQEPELTKALLRAIRKGYEFATAEPEAAAEILIQNAPETDPEFIKQSQAFLSQQYIADAKHWGIIDPKRWNAFYDWVNEQKLVETPLAENAGLSLDYLED